MKYSKLGRSATFHCLKDVSVGNFKYGCDNFFSNYVKDRQIQNPSCTRTKETSAATKDLKSMPPFMLLS